MARSVAMHQTISGPSLAATVAPRRGAKIVSLVDRSGYDWLLREMKVRPGHASSGSAFVDAGLSGWDECAPTIAQCQLPNGLHIPDHGDVWDAEWEGLKGRLGVVGRCLPYRLTRSITATAEGIRLDYEMEALSGPGHESAMPSNSVPLLWSAHPLFLAPPGSHVILEDVPAVIDVLSDPVSRVRWTPDLGSIDSVPPRTRRKLYIPPECSTGIASLEVLGHGRITMRWDPARIPYLGLWFDQCSLAHEPVIAIEPSTGYYDSLATAVRNGRVPYLKPGCPRRWSLEITIESQPPERTTASKSDSREFG